MLAHVFPLTNTLWGRSAYPQFKESETKTQSHFSIWPSLHSTGRVGFESSAETPALCYLLIHHNCSWWGLEAQRPQIGSQGVEFSCGQHYKAIFKNPEISQKECGSELFLKNRKFWQQQVCVPTWPWSRGAGSWVPLSMGPVLSPCQVCEAFEFVSLRATCWHLSWSIFQILPYLISPSQGCKLSTLFLPSLLCLLSP